MPCAEQRLTDDDAALFQSLTRIELGTAPGHALGQSANGRTSARAAAEPACGWSQVCVRVPVDAQIAEGGVRRLADRVRLQRRHLVRRAAPHAHTHHTCTCAGESCPSMRALAAGAAAPSKAWLTLGVPCGWPVAVPLASAIVFSLAAGGHCGAMRASAYGSSRPPSHESPRRSAGAAVSTRAHLPQVSIDRRSRPNIVARPPASFACVRRPRRTVLNLLTEHVFAALRP